ncbi:MAG: hypothetical protein ABIL09_07440 [Gemmatimonadota bacterium]
MADQTSALPVRVPLRLWRSHRTGPFRTRRDQRDLMVVDHPWVPGEAGAGGGWTAGVVLPPAVRGARLWLSFYQSDNYSGAWSDGPWMGVQAFVGHRFKQLCVDGRVLWEQDVADEEMAEVVATARRSAGPGAGYGEAYRVVELPAPAGRSVELVFRVVDRVASTQVLPGDAYRRFSWSAHGPHRVRWNFHTTVYFGDVFLTGEAAAVRPVDSGAARRHARSARPTPGSGTSPARSHRQLGRAVPLSGIPLALAATGPLPGPGCPVRCGVPLPEGRVAPGTSFALQDPSGAPVAAAVAETERWPDGSLRWVLCEFVARRRGRFRLVPGAPAAAPPADPVHVRAAEGLVVGHRLVQVHVGAAAGRGVFDRVTGEAGLSLGAMDLSLKLDRVGWRDHYTAVRRSAAVERHSPVCAVVRLEGDLLDEAGRRFGPWQVRLHLWAGLPCVTVDWRVVNESDQAMAVLLDWSARIGLPDLADARVDFGPFTPGYDPDDIGVRAMGHHGRVARPRRLPLYRDAELSCRQEKADQARVYRNTTWVATAPQASGCMALEHPAGGLVAACRWFAEEFPKGLLVRPDLLTIAVLPESQDALAWPHDRPLVRLGRGESKRQTFALWLHHGSVPPSQAQAFNRCVQDPPHLFDRAWFTSCQVVEAGPPRTRAALAAWARTVAPAIARTGIDAPRPGHREYWDTAWSNDYRGRTHIGLIQYLETGDPRWRRYFEAACTHNRDVDIIRFCPEHPDWVGASHTYGEDHTSTGPASNISANCDGLLDHYLMTGDADSRWAAAGLAEHVLTCNPWSRSARAVGWPLAQAVRWYEFSGDPRFLAKAHELVAAALAFVEPRRGVFDEQHGCYSYRGAVPFMTGYLAFGLIRYHRLTGDASTLALLRRLAAGLFAESRTGPGRFRYSPFPENNAPPVHRTRAWSGLVGGLAGYVHLATGEPRYAGWALECYEALVEATDELQASMDMLPIAGWMLHSVLGAAASG